MLSGVCAEIYRIFSKKSPKLVQKSEFGKILEETVSIVQGYADSLEDDYITVALAGEFSSGKSTLINALLENEILPSGDRPLTSINVQIQHSEKSYIRITWNKDLTPINQRIFLAKYAYWLHSWRQLNFISPQRELHCDSVKVTKIRNFLQKLETERKSASIYAADSVEIGIPFPEQWKKVCFIDVPGSGAINSVQKQILNTYKNQYILLYIVDAQRIGSNLSNDLIQQYSQLGAKVLVVVNKWDTIPRKEQEAKIEEVEECYGVKAVPFAGLPYLVSRLLATKQLKVKDLIREGKLNLATPMISPSWNARTLESNADYLADFLMERSNYAHFSNVLKNALCKYGNWNITQYKKKIKTLIQAYEEKLSSLKAEMESKTSEKISLEHKQERAAALRRDIENVCNNSVESYQTNFENEFRRAIDTAKNHLRARAKLFAEDELNKNAGDNWNVISREDYIGHHSWNDAGTILNFHSKLYRVNESSIAELNAQLSALDKSIPKLYPKLEVRQLEIDLAEITSSQKELLFSSLNVIAGDRNGYPGLLSIIFANGMQTFINRKRSRFHSAIDLITNEAFNGLQTSSFIESYKNSLSPIHQFTTRIGKEEQKYQQRINTLRREIEAAENELNMWQCGECTAAINKLNIINH